MTNWKEVDAKIAFAVANSVLRDSFEKGYTVCPMKLQKMIYFTYKKYLEDTGRVLFREQFQAWDHGPVLRTVYDKFKRFRANFIEQEKLEDDGPFIPAKEREFYSALGYVSGVYHDYSGVGLSEITHRDGTAWKMAIDREDRILSVEDIEREEWLTQA